MTAREALGLVGLFMVTAPGLAGMLAQALTGVSDAPSSSAAAGRGSPSPQTSPSAEITPRQRRSAEAASRSRVSSTPTGSPLSVTAYCATGHRTASGVWPEVGMAAGPWPFGTRLHVEDVGTVVVTDRYGWGTDLDLFVASCAAARQFGRRELLVAVAK